MWSDEVQCQIFKQIVAVAQNARRAGAGADRSFQEEEEFFAKYEREEDEAARQQGAAVNPADDLTADQNDDTHTGYGTWHSSRQVSKRAVNHKVNLCQLRRRDREDSHGSDAKIMMPMSSNNLKNNGKPTNTSPPAPAGSRRFQQAGEGQPHPGYQPPRPGCLSVSVTCLCMHLASAGAPA